ncbi:hypothetical protein [Luteimonas sp. 100069]|uniref:hypothetical protein n=1 Tax=Luteimonas sp. 100069 TaxID=2006109 RepID=UPI000F4E6B2D|nr:hypothetical protein [Luteimonas sp. 100069]RPD86504.1 hypothetical protein EGK76_07575 [Luteimonas sp. 100069]
MTRPPTSRTPSLDALERLVERLRADDIDAAIDAGLMDDWPDACARALESDARDLLLATRARLSTAWAARARFEARNARLARRAEVRDASRRAPRPGPAATAATPATADAAPTHPALPPKAAALLARAKARAGGATS